MRFSKPFKNIHIFIPITLHCHGYLLGSQVFITRAASTYLIRDRHELKQPAWCCALSNYIVILLNHLLLLPPSHRNTLDLLGADGYRAIAPDWVGHGDSDKPAPGQFEYSEEAYIKALGAFVEKLDIKKPMALVVHVSPWDRRTFCSSSTLSPGLAGWLSYHALTSLHLLFLH